jgi:hypothetical protein
MSKQAIAALAVTASLGGAAGFGLASGPQPADAAASNADVVKQLKIANKRLASIDTGVQQLGEKIGTTQASKGSVRQLLTLICDYTASVDCG